MENYFFNTETIAKAEKLYVLIIYDIVNNKRRNKMAKLLEGYGFRVQKSAFEALISEQLYDRLLGILPGIINKAEDSVRVYKFRGYGEVTLMGLNDTIKQEDVIII